MTAAVALLAPFLAGVLVGHVATELAAALHRRWSR